MTQEEKQLLLKDLCARLPYGVKVKQGNWEHILQSANMYNISFDSSCAIPKPYLRPMSSMTEEERTDLRMYCGAQEGIMYNVGVVGAFHSPAIIDFLNSHHLDYRGLIEKGLALEAPEGMYN